ncbi:MAG: hypothetical protein ACKVQS_04800 [Fimbriimonadaceae bacterium]
MNISAFNAATQSLRNAQAQALSAATKPFDSPDQIIDSVVSLQSAKLQTKLAVKTIQVLDDNAKTLIDMIA